MNIISLGTNLLELHIRLALFESFCIIGHGTHFLDALKGTSLTKPTTCITGLGVKVPDTFAAEMCSDGSYACYSLAPSYRHVSRRPDYFELTSYIN